MKFTREQRQAFIKTFGEEEYAVMFRGTGEETFVRVISADDYRSFNDGQFSGSDTVFWADECDLPETPKGQTIEIHGLSYTINDTMPDGSGFVKLSLQLPDTDQPKKPWARK